MATTKEGRTEPIYTRVLATQKRALEARARRRGFSLSMLIRIVIDAGLEALEKEERST